MNVRVTKPDYYDGFQCKGGQCRTTCCQQWMISLSQRDYKKAKKQRLSSELAATRDSALQRLRTGATASQYAKLRLNEDGMCPMLGAEGLCQWQLEAGADAIPNVCREFPRIVRWHGRQLGMELSCGCEKTVELLMEHEEPIRYAIEIENQRPEIRYAIGFTQELAMEKPIYGYFSEIMDLTLHTLQCRKLPLEKRMMTLGLFFQQIDQLEQQHREAEIPAYIESRKGILTMDEVACAWNSMPDDKRMKFNHMIFCMFDFFAHRVGDIGLRDIYARLGASGLSDMRWDVEKGKADLEYKIDFDQYEKACQGFKDFLKERNYIMENLVVSWMMMLEQPFQFKEYSLWENYTGFLGLYQAVRAIITGSIDGESADEVFVDLISSCSRQMTHEKSFIKRQILYAKTQNYTLAQLAQSIL